MYSMHGESDRTEKKKYAGKRGVEEREVDEEVKQGREKRRNTIRSLCKHRGTDCTCLLSVITE